MPRYIVFGAGAIGSIVGAALHRSGQDALLIGRGPQVQAIRKEGLRLISGGIVRRVKVNVAEDLRALKPRQDDILLITVKSQDTETAAKHLSGTYGPQTMVVSLQNAVRNEEILARRFERVYGGLVEFSGNYLSPGIVEHTRNNLVAVGRYPQGVDEMAARITADPDDSRVFCGMSPRGDESEMVEAVAQRQQCFAGVAGVLVTKGSQ